MTPETVTILRVLVTALTVLMAGGTATLLVTVGVDRESFIPAAKCVAASITGIVMTALVWSL